MNESERDDESRNEPDLSATQAPEIAQPEQSETASRQGEITMTFVKEVIILGLGVFIGFLWHMYYQTASNEAHLIVILLLVVLCLVRYIYLFLKR